MHTQMLTVNNNSKIVNSKQHVKSFLLRHIERLSRVLRRDVIGLDFVASTPVSLLQLALLPVTPASAVPSEQHLLKSRLSLPLDPSLLGKTAIYSVSHCYLTP